MQTRILEDQLDLGDDGLRYLGDEPFTGTAFVLSRTGSVEAEDDYRDGLRWGISRGWHPSGELAHECRIEAGLRMGIAREWRDNGKLAAEDLFEHGVRISGKRCDEDDRLVE